MSFYADAQALGNVIASGHGVIRVASGRKFAPDVFFIRQERIPSPLPKAFEGAPDLVVEVLSPSNRRDDIDDKRPAYHDAGVGELWFVDAELRQIIIDRQQGQDYVEEVATVGRVASTVLTGFWIDAAWLWADPLPNRMACLQEILSREQTGR